MREHFSMFVYSAITVVYCIPVWVCQFEMNLTFDRLGTRLGPYLLQCTSINKIQSQLQIITRFLSTLFVFCINPSHE